MEIPSIRNREKERGIEDTGDAFVYIDSQFAAGYWGRDDKVQKSVNIAHNPYCQNNGQHRSVIIQGMFYFYPFLLAVSAAKRFKTNPYMALSLAERHRNHCD